MKSKESLNVLGVAGSIRKDSYNRALLRAAQELAPEGMAIVTFERVREIPLYDEDLEARSLPDSVVAFREAIRSADALLVVTPEYNHGLPGLLKNAIDWASRPPETSPLRGKPAAIMGASTGTVGTARAQDQLRQVFVFTETYALDEPEILVGNCVERFDARGRLTDQVTRGFIRRQLEALMEFAARLRD